MTARKPVDDISETEVNQYGSFFPTIASTTSFD